VVDNEVVTKLAEVDMIVADLERANSRVATVERRNVSSFSPKIQYTTNPSLQEILRAEIESLRTGTETSALVKNLSSQITDLESECDRLSQALDAQKSLVGEAEERLGKRVEDVEREGRGKVLFFFGLRLGL
jgi:homeobox protein cut-like